MAESDGSGKRFDALVIVLLLGVLIGGAILTGRSGLTETEEQKAPGVRQVDPTLIAFREAEPIVPNAKRLRGLAVGEGGSLFLSAGFEIIEYDRHGAEQDRYALDSAARCLAKGPGDRLYLGCGDHVMMMHTREKTPPMVWDSLGEKAFITSVAVGEDRVFVADAGNRKLWVYDLVGRLQTEIGGSDGGPPTAGAPGTYFDVAYSEADACFWVTDAGKLGVVRYSPEGVEQGRWGKGSEAIEDFSGCCNPTQLAVLTDGRLVTAEKKPDLVKVYTASGTLDSVVAPPRAFIQKTFVSDVVTDALDQVFLLDPKKNQIRIFKPWDRQ